MDSEVICNFQKKDSLTDLVNKPGLRDASASKNPYQKKLRWSKKGEGLSFLTESHKKPVFFYPSPNARIIFILPFFALSSSYLHNVRHHYLLKKAQR